MARRPSQFGIDENSLVDGLPSILDLPGIETIGTHFFLGSNLASEDVIARCTELAALLYQQFIERIVTVSCSDSAEMVKLLENTFRSVNIALANEMALMCHNSASTSGK